ncbi:phage terminase small subunit [Levilactobacillus andaensis]|uniref:phage terminase small subunit n=1 Tax=Levilactobacillus andaensis TaxID=2799570 RepID=UPI001941960A|nr:phage terminase small subunit [Levilactobacillus andaensis]
MARARNPKRDKAKQMWLESDGKRHLKDIAEELGVSPSQIRKWKSLDKWSDELKGNVTNDGDTEKERYHSSHHNQNAAGNDGGAPPGNKNAVGNVGGAAPKGNRNALVTGEYETIDFDTMSDKERTLFEGVTDDPLLTINTQIRTLKIRQHRIMERIKARQEMEDADAVDRSVNVIFDTHNKVYLDTGKAVQNRKIDDLGRLDSALNAVNIALMRAVKQKQQIISSLSDERRSLLNIQIELAQNELLSVKEKTGELNLRKQMGQLSVEELKALRKGR